MEERAIEELTKLYADLESHGVAVTVERMSGGVSAPTWAARAIPQKNASVAAAFPSLSASIGYR